MVNYDMYDSPTRRDPNCRTCTDFKTWSRKQQAISQTISDSNKVEVIKTVVPETPIPSNCPLDRDSLGHTTWSLLHTMAAVYPDNPTDNQKRDTTKFYDVLSRLYPCDYCARDFQQDLRSNPVDASSQETLSQWLCNFHNRVNTKLGKPVFDCTKVNERWRDGWKDGSCD